MNNVRWLRKGDDLPVIVCIHGWAANSEVWQPLADCLPFNVLVIDLPGFETAAGANIDNEIELKASAGCENSALNTAKPSQLFTLYIQYLAAQLKRLKITGELYILGWSLGGQVAAALAEQLEREGSFAGLITLASNPCFVANNTWPTAMAVNTFEQFYQGFKAQPALTLKRFHGLQSAGACNIRALRAEQKTILPHAPQENTKQHLQWLNALAWLQQDTRSALQNLQAPQLHLLAENDALVPANMPLHSFGEVQILANSGHCLPLEAPKKIARAVIIFIKTHQQKALNKTKVAEAFSLAAERYDAFARVQKIVAQSVLQKAPQANNAIILDLGSGTGALTQGLLQNTQPAQVLALDIAQGMLRFAQSRTRNKVVSFIAGDAENLPIASHSIDGIVSSLAIQWCEQPAHLMQELYRVLKPGGWAVIATLGPGTLCELKAAWQAIDDCVHVNAFASRAALEHACSQAGFDMAIVQQTQQCDYPCLMPLLKELKAIGAHNSHVNAPAGLMTRAKIKQLEQHYPLSQSANIVASYDVFYLHLNKPVA